MTVLQEWETAGISSSSLRSRRRAGLSLSLTQPRPEPRSLLTPRCTGAGKDVGTMGRMWEEEEGCRKGGVAPFFHSTMRPCVKESLSQMRWGMVQYTISHISPGELWGLSLLNRTQFLQRTLEVPLPRHPAGPWAQRSVLHQPRGQ